jgi:hypothetical protein
MTDKMSLDQAAEVMRQFLEIKRLRVPLQSPVIL